ncbi:MAG: [protein-PII] uridylyltransferase [Mycobacteriales bacterium]
MSVDLTRSDRGAALRSHRARLLERGFAPEILRRALSACYDTGLAKLLPEADGVALVAVGSLGRREVMPYGDIDLIVVHSGQRDVSTLVEPLWYSIWDAGIGLDHSVRTQAETLRLAGIDLAVALGLIDARPIAGDLQIGFAVREAARVAWRRGAHRWVGDIAEGGRERAARHGELAFLIEPDLKNAAGGLRDALALHALSVAQLADPVSGDAAAAVALLLDVRTHLHLRAGRALDRLVHQEQGPLAHALGFDDADHLMRAVSGAGRVIGYRLASALRRIPADPGPRIFRRRTPIRRSLGDGIVEHAGEVAFARGADPVADPALALRAAATAARVDLPLAPHVLARIAETAAQLTEPWPDGVRDALLALLGAGPGLVAVIDALDHASVLTDLLPEWSHVRFRPQRDAAHRFTVDRHLVETAVRASELIHTVSRPDLLLLTAFLHDIGKGAGGDHSVIGARFAGSVAMRVGLPADDAALIATAVRHHLLLPDTATRRDLDDPATVAIVTDAIGHSRLLLDLLAALAVADGLATGRGAWSNWKAGLVNDLVDRVRRSLLGEPLPRPPALRPDQRALLGGAEPAVLVYADEVTVAAPDATGLLSATAGVLALHHLDVRAATLVTEAETTVNVFRVVPRYGSAPDPDRLRADVRRVLAGTEPARGGVAGQLRNAERFYRGRDAPVGAPEVVWFDDEASEATIVEVRADDAVGLLYRIAVALETCGVRVLAARVSTLGTAAVDAFYVVDGAGCPLTDPQLRAQVTADVLTALR